jgi:hypothetical protein
MLASLSIKLKAEIKAMIIIMEAVVKSKWDGVKGRS